jgi:hypothetical protein
MKPKPDAKSLKKKTDAKFTAPTVEKKECSICAGKKETVTGSGGGMAALTRKGVK